ncbi:MAG: molybdenum ABC transporter ATP-binding protein [Gemmatimonadetes bacterium]|nr:molybdenum ABC transporter ATP-binding protein [Gemmatimonadota bacterium]
MSFLQADFRLRLDTLTLEGDFRFDSGITAVFGPSGSGKTTLLHVLAGLRAPDTGRIVRNGDVLFDSSTGVDVPPERRETGVVFQDLRLFPHLDVRGNLRFGSGSSPVTGAPVPETKVVEVLELGSLLDRAPRTLSGGEARRVALGRALLAGPRILLLDEPTTGLDAARRQSVLGLLDRIHAEFGIPLVLVSHSLPEILQLTRQLIVLDQGAIVGSGPLQDVLGTDRVFQLAHELGLESIVQVSVEEADRVAGVVRARLGTEPVLLPFTEIAAGQRALIGLRPEDVILARGPVSGISAQNALAGTVVEVTDVADRRLVTVRIGGETGDVIRAEITHGSSRELGIEPGASVTCLVKVFSFRWRRRV